MAFDFKEEKEVKQFLENLGIEYRFGCFSEKNPEVCHLLGDYLEAIKKDFEKSAKVYKSNCDDYNYPRSCYKYGNYSLLGRGHKTENPSQALEYFEKGCSLNDNDSCLHSGLMLVMNQFKDKVQMNVDKGIKYLEKACDGKVANACYYLSGMYISGIKKEPEKKDHPDEYEVARNMNLAFKYAQKGCDLRNMYSCANLSQMYARGEGAEQNLVLAEKYKKLAMEIQDDYVRTQPTLTFQEGLKPT